MRTFTAQKAVRSKVPLLIGIYGPSGSGKTFSALRLATGIQRIMPGRIVVADSEAKRALHYASNFDFDHVPFEPPYSPNDYAELLRFCVARKPSSIVIDSGSHLHEGPGGMLEMHDDELKRMGGSDKNNFSAWIKPKRQLVALVGELLRMECNFIWCFRAKEKLKIIPGKQPVALGWLPIMPDELPYEMTVNALLEPGAGGVPQWKPSAPGEQAMVKLPQHFRELLTSGKPFDEDMGAALARWAAGDAAPAQVPTFSAGFNGLAGKPLDSVPIAKVAEYITYLEGRLVWARENKQGKAEFGIKQALESAMKFYDDMVAAEMDRVKQDSNPAWGMPGQEAQP